tara:strand:- start:2709 stop:2888 length:180 start_codon:yes stop_codon:yes gene_type:complete
MLTFELRGLIEPFKSSPSPFKIPLKNIVIHGLNNPESFIKKEPTDDHSTKDDGWMHEFK